MDEFTRIQQLQRALRKDLARATQLQADGKPWESYDALRQHLILIAPTYDSRATGGSTDFSRRLSRGSAGQVDVDAPPANFRRDAVGHKRQGRLITCGGPSQSKDSHADVAAIACEPSRMHSRTAQWINVDYNTGYSHGERPHMAIADVHHTCHIG